MNPLSSLSRSPRTLIAAIPLFLLLVWVERNMAMPVLGAWLMQNGLGLPIVFLEGGLAWAVGFDSIFLGVLSGSLFAMLMQNRLSEKAQGLLIGIAALAVLAFWQPTGIVLFQAIPSALIASSVSMLLFWGFLFLSARAKAPAERRLFLGLAFFATPMLSLDRLLFGAVLLFAAKTTQRVITPALRNPV